MIAVILAAGRSRRLGKLADSNPKPLIVVGDRPLLQHQLDIISQCGIREAVIVVGYKKEKIVETFGRKYGGVDLTYVANDIYHKTNTVYSLWLTREYFRDTEFLYFNADVLAHPEVVERLLKSSRENLMAVERKECGAEEVKVICDPDGRIKRIGKELDPAECEGEFIGIAKFSRGMNSDFASELEEVIKEGGEQSFFEKAVDRLLLQHRIYMEDITGLPVVEIDFPEDLEFARNVVYPKIYP